MEGRVSMRKRGERRRRERGKKDKRKSRREGEWSVQADKGNIMRADLRY